VREFPVKDAGDRSFVDKDISRIEISGHQTRFLCIGLLLYINPAQVHGGFGSDPGAYVGAFEHGSDKAFPIAKIKWRYRSVCLNPTA
jgi:hypothetical protein